MEKIKIYHYTNRLSLKKIIQEKAIVPSSGFSGREKSAVWLSSSKTWEKTASSLAVNPKGGIRKRNIPELEKIGMVRIEIDLSMEKLFNISQYKKISKISQKNFTRLFNYSRECGSDINEWWVSFSSIPIKSFKNIEIYHPHEKIWESFNLDSEIKKELKNQLILIKDLINFMTPIQRKRLSLILEKLS